MDRGRALRELANNTFDLLVIGGGITGAGVAREASLRGFRVALVEQNDFGSGTSSRSTKLIHGGLRYLKQLDFGLVAEAVRERQLLLGTAPHLVEATAFLFPVYRGDPDSLIALRAGLLAYDLFARLQAPVPHRMLAVGDVLSREPYLRASDLVGGAVYTDSRTDDGRLTLAVLRSAVQFGAMVANYAGVEAFLRRRDGCVAGAVVVDSLSGERLEVRASRVLVAAGPWADQLRRLDDPAAPPILRLTKGAHLAVPAARVPLRHAVVIRGRDRERRMMFAIPHGQFTYVGTTDTDYSGDPAALTVECTDVRYILEAANTAFPEAHLGEADVISTWVGLRPLVRPSRATTASAVSRDYQLFRAPSGLVSVGGGKLSAFRGMAEHIVDDVLPGSKTHGSQRLSRAVLPGADGPLPTQADWTTLARATGTTADRLSEWCGIYGSDLEEVAACRGSTDLQEPALEWHRAMTRYAVDCEMAQRLEDVYRRRTGLMLFSHDNGRSWLETLASDMAELLNWSADRRREEISRTMLAIDRMFAFRADSKAAGYYTELTEGSRR
jgi:glycerol-3-phosphate dehydrogenase